jgi:hypothetical protein
MKPGETESTHAVAVQRPAIRHPNPYLRLEIHTFYDQVERLAAEEPTA